MKQTLLFLFFLLQICGYGQKHDDAAISFDIQKSAISNLVYAPQDESRETNKGTIIVLKDPSGKEMTFQCYENTTMSEEMKKAYPTLRTYTGYDVTDKNTTATITSYNGVLQGHIHPQYGMPIEIKYDQEALKYTSTFHHNDGKHQCELDESQELIESRTHHSPDRSLMPQNGSVLKTFRMGIVVTDRFVDSFELGNPVAGVAAAMAVMNDINAVYKRTLAVVFSVSIIVDINGLYTIQGVNFGLAASTVRSYFTETAYDVGHLFDYNSGGGSGVAALGVACRETVKSQGYSSGLNYSLLYDIAVHEIGHQFKAGHTFNGTIGICGAQFDGLSSVEPGSGTTIMSYSDACGTDNLTFQNGTGVPPDNTYFHAASIKQMLDYINTQSCYSSSTIVNTPPVASANPCGVIAFSIPKSTPFELIGSATDANNDNITYQWDQVDTGTGAAPGTNCGSTTGPIFRSYPPSSSPKRTFPALEYILNNQNSPTARVGECLPSSVRTLNFKFIARDNNINAGGIDVHDLAVTVTNTGPLQVTSPNTNVTYAAGSSQTITWSVNNTNTISDSVNILLSVDGGTTWPYTLAETPNDGSQSVSLPANIPGGAKARIRIESRKYSCFKFFDVSNVNFTITSPCVAITTIISPVNNLVTTLGNAALNLGMQNNFGTPVTAAITGSITTGDTPGNLIFLDGTTCVGPSNPTYYDLLPFSVSTAGNYTISHGGVGSWVINLYANQFTGANCNNHISSSAVFDSGSGFVFTNSSLTASLNINTIYYLMISRFSGAPTSNPNYSINFPTKPAGATVYQGGPAPITNYSYTYIAVNKQTNIIAQQSSTSNFTTLPSGTYDIYGIHYYSGTGSMPPNVDPTTWVNQNFNTVKNSPTCIAISSNSRQVTVQECILTVTTEAASGAESFASRLSTIPPGCKVVFASTIDNISLSSQVDITSNNITIDGTGQNVLINFASGSNGTADYLIRNTATGVTFKNVNFKHTNPKTTANVLRNEGTITLDGVTLTGNVNEVLKNQTSNTSSVTVKGAVSIRKI
jgi:hypothetical protein